MHEHVKNCIDLFYITVNLFWKRIDKWGFAWNMLANRLVQNLHLDFDWDSFIWESIMADIDAYFHLFEYDSISLPFVFLSRRLVVQWKCFSKLLIALTLHLFIPSALSFPCFALVISTPTYAWMVETFMSLIVNAL